MSGGSPPGSSGPYVSAATVASRATDDRLDRVGDVVHIGHAVDLPQDAFLPVIGEDRRGLLAVGHEPGFHRLRLVVGAADEIMRAADVAHALDLGPTIAVVIAGAAFGASEAAGEAVDERRLVDGELDDAIELQPFL